MKAIALQGQLNWRVLGALSVAFGMVAGLARADNLAALHGLGLGEGAAYAAQRDALLAAHPQAWDVEAACGYSWQAGLAAYILNGRLAEPEQFAKWETEVEQASKAMHLSTPGSAFRQLQVSPAFRLEFAWKPPEWVNDFRWDSEAANRSPHQAARAGALAPDGWCVPMEGTPLALWRAIWRESNETDFRAVAIAALSRSDSSADQQLARNALFDGDEEYAIRREALYGYTARDPAGSVDDCVKLISDRTTTPELAIVATSALGNNLSRLEGAYRRARAFLEVVAGDGTRPEALRCAALEACKRDQRSDNIDVLRTALMQTKHPKLQLTAIVENAQLRQALRHAMYNYGDPGVVSTAATALLNLGRAEDLAYVRGYVDDPAVSDEARQRVESALHGFSERKRVSERLEQERQERVE